jgi:hypothetical protein
MHSSNEKIRRFAKYCAIAWLAAGCSSYVPVPVYVPAPVGVEYQQAFSVLVQTCLPTPSSKSVSMSRIARYGDRGEFRSATGIITSAVANSGPNQVMQGFSHRRPIDIVAILLNRDQDVYVFDVTNTQLSAEFWTAWEAPVSANSREESVGYRLANHQPYQIRKPTDTAPKARYRLVRNIDWSNKVPRQNEEVPPCF